MRSNTPGLPPSFHHRRLSNSPGDRGRGPRVRPQPQVSYCTVSPQGRIGSAQWREAKSCRSGCASLYSRRICRISAEHVRHLDAGVDSRVNRFDATEITALHAMKTSGPVWREAQPVSLRRGRVLAQQPTRRDVPAGRRCRVMVVIQRNQLKETISAQACTIAEQMRSAR